MTKEDVNDANSPRVLGSDLPWLARPAGMVRTGSASVKAGSTSGEISIENAADHSSDSLQYPRGRPDPGGPSGFPARRPVEPGHITLAGSSQFPEHHRLDWGRQAAALQ